MAMDHAYRIPVIDDDSMIIRFLAYGALWWWMVGQLHKDKGEDKGREFRGMNALKKSGIGLRDFYVNGIVFVMKYRFCGVTSDEAGEASACMQQAGKSRKMHCRGNRVEDTTTDVASWGLVGTMTKGTYERKWFYEPNIFQLKDVIIDQRIYASSVSYPYILFFASFRTFSHLFVPSGARRRRYKRASYGLASDSLRRVFSGD